MDLIRMVVKLFDYMILDMCLNLHRTIVVIMFLQYEILIMYTDDWLIT